MRRRSLLLKSTQGACLLAAASLMGGCSGAEEMSEEQALELRDGLLEGPGTGLFFRLSLAQWSLHRSLWSGEMDHLDFAAEARALGFSAVEYVNTFFADRATDTDYLDEMNLRAADAGVSQLLIMVDAEGSLGDGDDVARREAVDNHHKWVDAAARLGCHSIRVNAQGKGEAEEVAERVAESLGMLAQYAAPAGISILVENHGGYSSDAAWLAGVMRAVNMENCGTLPDFGNFTLSMFPPRTYDRYRGVEELMPWARGVSAKSYDFTASGEESSMDYRRLLGIVAAAGYRGHIGVEYEGSRLSERAGVLATASLLRRTGAAL
jgi:sugar phosphate isomerase/epimerase